MNDDNKPRAIDRTSDGHVFSWQPQRPKAAPENRLIADDSEDSAESERRASAVAQAMRERLPPGSLESLQGMPTNGQVLLAEPILSICRKALQKAVAVALPQEWDGKTWPFEGSMEYWQQALDAFDKAVADAAPARGEPHG